MSTGGWNTTTYEDDYDFFPSGPLIECLEIAGDMLAKTKEWYNLIEYAYDVGNVPDQTKERGTAMRGGDFTQPRKRIFIAEVPLRLDSSNIHEPDAIASRAPYAIVHFDDEGVAASFTHQASPAEFASRSTVIIRLYLTPPKHIDPDDINVVERWVLHTVGRIIRGPSATEPGLLDLSHRGGMLMIRQLDVLGPAYPSIEQRGIDQAFYVAVELVLQIGIG